MVEKAKIKWKYLTSVITILKSFPQKSDICRLRWGYLLGAELSGLWACQAGDWTKRIFKREGKASRQICKWEKKSECREQIRHRVL